MTKQRKFLTCSIIVLLIIYAVQLIFINRSTIKILKTKDDITFIEISRNGQTFSFDKKAGSWFFTEEQYEASKASVEEIVRSLKEITVLGTITKAEDDNTLLRYGLDSPINVTAQAGKKKLELEIGKQSVTNNQTYIRLNGKKDILLISGNLRDLLSTEKSDFRDKTVYSVKSGDIFRIALTTSEGQLTVEKEGEDDFSKWSVPGRNQTELDQDKINEWVSAACEITVSEWKEKDLELPAIAAADLTLTTASKIISLKLFKESGDDENYICKSSESEYPFTLDNEKAETLIKKISELVLKKE